MSAPMNPTAMATRKPPRENPAIAWAIAPQMPAIKSRIRKSRSPMVPLTRQVVWSVPYSEVMSASIVPLRRASVRGGGRWVGDAELTSLCCSLN